METRLISLALTLALCFGQALPALAAEDAAGTPDPGYTDVPADCWCADSIARATELGLFQGLGDGRFGRGEPITRAAFITALVRLFGWNAELPADGSFTDASPGSWYYAAVETAYANGAVAASDHAFRPGDNISRGEMVTMLVRGLGYTALAGTISTYSSPFTDVSANKGFISIAYDMALVDGVGDGRFDPNGHATREQAAVLLVRVYDLLHAPPTAMQSAGGYTRVAVAAPRPAADDEIPTTPLEPLADLYIALRQLKSSGTDMGQVVLCLSAGGVRTLVEKNAIVSTDRLTASQVEEVLASAEDLSAYYSDRYECAYCIYQAGYGREATLWYQSERSLAAKLQLASLFGVTRYVLE